MRLAMQTWAQVERYLREKNAILIPTGATEQHGPNGLIGTDLLIAEALALAIGERCGVLVHPVLPVGMSQHHLGFPGTASFTAAGYGRQLVEVVESLARHGFRTFYFVNGHGGNTAPASAAASDLLTRREDITWIWRSWWERPEVKALEDDLIGERNGDHATAAEISMTMHLFPGAVTPIPPIDWAKPAHEWPLAPGEFRRLFPDGRMYSDPSLASADKGKRLFELCVDLYAAELAALVNGAR